MMTFKEFPPRQRAANFSVGQITERLQQSLGATQKQRATAALVIASCSLIGGCTAASAQVQPPPSQLANPASQNCVARGGMLNIERRPDGGQYGVCVFADNYQCEEWAMFRGDCPVGGLRVTGYITPAARYCAITGGRYTVVANSGAADEQGACALPGGKACEAKAYFAGACSR